MGDSKQAAMVEKLRTAMISGKMLAEFKSSGGNLNSWIDHLTAKDGELSASNVGACEGEHCTTDEEAKWRDVFTQMVATQEGAMDVDRENMNIEMQRILKLPK